MISEIGLLPSTIKWSWIQKYIQVISKIFKKMFRQFSKHNFQNYGKKWALLIRLECTAVRMHVFQFLLKIENKNNFKNKNHWPELLHLVPYMSSLNWFKDQFVTIVIYRFGRNASKNKTGSFGHFWRLFPFLWDFRLSAHN
jgi:hypothetical protein